MINLNLLSIDNGRKVAEYVQIKHKNDAYEMIQEQLSHQSKLQNRLCRNLRRRHIVDNVNVGQEFSAQKTKLGGLLR